MYFTCCTLIRPLVLSPCILTRIIFPKSHFNRKDPESLSLNSLTWCIYFFCQFWYHSMVLVHFHSSLSLFFHRVLQILEVLIVFYTAQRPTVQLETHSLVSCLKMCFKKCSYKFATKNLPWNTTGFSVTSFFFHRICVHLLLQCCNKEKNFTHDFHPLEVTLRFSLKKSFPSPQVQRLTLLWMTEKESLFSGQEDMWHTIRCLALEGWVLGNYCYCYLLSFSLFLTSQ